MSDIRTIEHDGEIYAKIFKADTPAENGVKFFTNDEDPLQVGVFDREEGYEVIPHRHNPLKVELSPPGEFIWIQSGSADVKIFDNDWSVIEEVTVAGGDCIIILKGGHSFTMLEQTRILEVKQGPYPGREKEKTFRDSQ